MVTSSNAFSKIILVDDDMLTNILNEKIIKSVQPQCKIINVDQNLGKYFEITIRYVVEVFNNYDELIETFVLEDEIKRRLRPKEIEKFENKKISDDDFDKCIEGLKEIADSIKGTTIHINIGDSEKAKKTIEDGEKIGIKFF